VLPDRSDHPHREPESKDPPNRTTTTTKTTTQPRILPSRRAKKAAIHKSLAHSTTTYHSFRKQHQHQRRGSGGKNNGDSDDSDSDDDDDDETVETMHSAILSLGRSLRAHYGPEKDEHGHRLRSRRRRKRTGILVLDKAEELLSLATKKGSLSSNNTNTNTNNVLSELLLMPKILKLNLTIVVVTNYATLDMTRLNNAVAPSRGLATLSSGVHPIVVTFPAYKGNRAFREILSTAENQRLVMGDSLPTSLAPDAGASASAAMPTRPSFRDKLVRTFWNTVLQFASDSTRDVRDFRRIGRALWPRFAAPLAHPAVFRKTLKGVATNKLGIRSLTRSVLGDPKTRGSLEDELVSALGTLFYPQIAALAGGDENLALLAFDESGGWDCLQQPKQRRQQQQQQQNPSFAPAPHLPYPRSCLLLAAFVCQHNKADRDRKLFSSHGNGRRSRSKAKANEDLYGGNDEDLAFGSTNKSSSSSSTSGNLHTVEQLRLLKLRPVPLERVLSVFVTLVRLNPLSGDDPVDDEEEDERYLDHLGSSRLYRDLSHLVELGYLHSSKGNQQVLCSLTKEGALGIANRIGIPLERYLI